MATSFDYATIDYAVNSGPARAAKALQGILGVAQDGKIGPMTIKAAQAADHLRSSRPSVRPAARVPC